MGENMSKKCKMRASKVPVPLLTSKVPVPLLFKKNCGNWRKTAKTGDMWLWLNVMGAVRSGKVKEDIANRCAST